MAFVVEDGTGKTTSTSYVTVAYADTYADSFFSLADFAIWDALTEANKERYLNRASQYIDTTYKFSGDKATYEQAMQFPRDNLYDSDGDLIEDTVPSAVQQATVLAARRLINDVELSPDYDRGAVIREKVDTIDVTYAQGASRATRFSDIDKVLRASGIVVSNRDNNVNVRLTVY